MGEVVGGTGDRPVQPDVNFHPSLLHQRHAKQARTSLAKRNRPSGKGVLGANSQQRHRLHSPLVFRGVGGFRRLDNERSQELDGAANVGLHRNTRSGARRDGCTDAQPKGQGDDHTRQSNRRRGHDRRGSAGGAQRSGWDGNHCSSQYVNSFVNSHSPWPKGSFVLLLGIAAQRADRRDRASNRIRRLARTETAV